MDTSMESKQSNMILSKKPEVESSFLKIPLEMLREIYHICSPDPTLLIWACPPPPPPRIQLCNEIGKLRSCCKQIQKEITDLEEENKNEGLEIWGITGW